MFAVVRLIIIIYALKALTICILKHKYFVEKGRLKKS